LASAAVSPTTQRMMASQSARPIEKTAPSCNSRSKDGGHDGEHRHLIVSMFAATSMRCALDPVLRRRALQLRHSRGTRSCAVTIGQMPEALIIPSIMLRRGQNGMNAMSSSYDWMRQRRKRRAACRSSLQPAYLGLKSIAAQTCPCLVIYFVIIGRSCCDFVCVRCVLMRSFLVRNWCGCLVCGSDICNRV
jgi:hypothetical protein